MKDKFGMVGQPLMEFALPNSRGETIDNQMFRNQKNLVIVLLRDIN